MRTSEVAEQIITSASTPRYRGPACVGRRAFYPRNEGRGCEVNGSGEFLLLLREEAVSN